MRYLSLLVYWLCSAAVVAAQTQISLTTCGLGCLVQDLPASGCSASDTVCQCTSKTLAVDVSQCMLSNCTMEDSRILSEFQANLCHLPTQDRSRLVICVFAAIITVTFTIVLLRFASKIFKGTEGGPEDWILLLAVIATCFAIFFTVRMAKEGFGKHMYSLQAGALTKILKNFYLAENIYVYVLAFTKLSILAFYLRIFQFQPTFRLSVYIAMAFTIGSTIIISVLTIFQCSPLQYFWDRDIKGRCLDVNKLAYANSAMSMIQDVIIVVLPIPVVFQINLEKKKKIGVAFMFALGGLGTIISAIRLRSLLIFGNSIDPSWDYVYVTIWTAAELGVAMIASCLPALRTLFVTVYHLSRSFNVLPSFSSSAKETVSGSGWSWRRGNKRFEQMKDTDIDMTKITINGESWSYPKKAPPVPSKTIKRDSDGKFRPDDASV